MTPFRLFAPAKINLALHVLGRRADGYHELDSIVAFADTGDWLNFEPAGDFDIVTEGPFAAHLPSSNDNIIATAWHAMTRLMAERGMALPPVRIRLTKNLPVASGIGGGSANAAAALKGFLQLSRFDAADLGFRSAVLRLGADVPVCLDGRACRMQGIGERIEPFPAFAPLHAILVNPGVEVQTAEVFRRLALDRGASHALPIADVANASAWRNDLVAPAVMIAPVIAEVMAVLQRLEGVRRVTMSGSGATCLALFDSRAAAEQAAGILQASHPDWWTTAATLR